MSRIDELPALGRVPGLALLARTDALRLAFSADPAALHVRAALFRQNHEGLLGQGIRAWALTLGELGVPRLPGGMLAVDLDEPVDGHADHHAVCTCNAPEGEHHGDAWYVDADATMLAARNRDGDELFAIIRRAVFSDRHPSEIFGYVASVASSSCLCFAESGARREVDALLHLLAYHAMQPQHWSVAGYAYRLCAAMMTAIDMGVDGTSDMILGPEIEALGRLDELRWSRIFAVAGKAFASIMADDPDDPVARFTLTISDTDPSAPAQHRGVTIAGEAAMLFRSNENERLVDMLSALRPADLPLGVFGMCHLLTVRLRDLYG